MNENLMKLYNSDYTHSAKARLKKNMEIALKAHSMFLNDNREYLTEPTDKTVQGYLRSYAIKHQMYRSCFKPDSPFTAKLIEVNKFKCQALFLLSDNFMLNISRTLGKLKMPAEAGYKIKASQNNGEFYEQLWLDLPECEPEYPLNGKKYAVLTYNVDCNNEYSHMAIMVPNPGLKSFMYYDSILELAHVVEMDFMPEEEEEIVSLKKTIESEARKLS